MGKINPLVSIIVVSYNQAKYIQENLDSIKSQTYTNVELIVADDASSDNTVEVFNTWLRENNYPALKVFHKENKGLVNTLNECIEIANGKYIKLLAADDYIHPQLINKAVTKLEELGNEYGMVFTDTFSIDDNSNIIADIADYDKLGNVSPELFRKELVRGNRIAALTTLIRKDVLLETGKYDSKFIVEDYYRWLKINEKYFIAYIPEKLAYYRQHENNISKIKANRIELEDLKLKLIFDKTGIAKDFINNWLYINYMNNYKFESELKKLYNNYPFRIKRLNFAISYNLPVYVYKSISRFI